MTLIAGFYIEKKRLWFFTKCILCCSSFNFERSWVEAIFFINDFATDYECNYHSLVEQIQLLIRLVVYIVR